MSFKRFKKKYGKDGKISSKDIKKFLGGGGSQAQAQKFLDKAKSKGEVKYTDNEIEGISVLLGVSAAVLTGIGIHKVLSKG